MVTIWDIKKSEISGVNETPKVLVELRGLSSDTKPKLINNAVIENGSSFLEIDTNDIYYMDLDTEKDWIKPTSPEEVSNNETPNETSNNEK